jgi:hypothetical protein
MGTRSRIGMKLEDGTIKHSYCQYDGFPEGVGKTLEMHYNNIEKVEELLSFGDMSCLEEKIHPSGIHNFKISENGVTVFYGRDRGDSNVDAQVTSIDEFESKEFTTCIDYLYLFSEGKWFVKSLIDSSGWKLVTDSLLELALM